jgi:hypothetical protein
MAKSKMEKTAEGLVLRVILDDEQINELRDYITKCFESIRIERSYTDEQFKVSDIQETVTELQQPQREEDKENYYSPHGWKTDC